MTDDEKLEWKNKNTSRNKADASEINNSAEPSILVSSSSLISSESSDAKEEKSLGKKKQKTKHVAQGQDAKESVVRKNDLIESSEPVAAQSAKDNNLKLFNINCDNLFSDEAQPVKRKVTTSKSSKSNLDKELDRLKSLLDPVSATSESSINKENNNISNVSSQRFAPLTEKALLASVQNKEINTFLMPPPKLNRKQQKSKERPSLLNISISVITR
jgi:hypothetical protein